MDHVEISDSTRLVRDPLVSVNMITYNHELFLAEAIEGIVNQKTIFPFELIIGEDCSTDSTREIALAYQQRFPEIIRVIYSESNVGAKRNSKRVIINSRGSFVAHCEGDDYWHNDKKLDLQIGFLLENPDYTIVHSEYDLHFDLKTHRSVNSNFYNNIPQGDVFERLICHNFITTCTVVLSLPILKAYMETGIYSNRYAMGDYPMWLYAAMKGKVGYIPQSLATYRQNIGSAMHRGPVAAANMLLSLCKVRNDFCNIRACSVETKTLISRINNKNLLMAACLTGNYVLFSDEYRWFKANKPEWHKQFSTRVRNALMRLHLSWIFRLKFNIIQFIKLRSRF